MNPIVIYRAGGFGDRLLAAQMTMILRDHGIPATFWDSDPEFRKLLCVPFATGEPSVHYWFHYRNEHAWDGRGILRKALDNFAAAFKTGPIEITQKYAPIRYSDDPTISGVDVCMCLRSGAWSKYRDYPLGDELKAEMDRRGITWIDLNEAGKVPIHGIAALNWARKSKLYLGVDTGTTHYVAPFVQKALILQSGFTNKDYWAPNYPFEFLSVSVECGNCFKLEGCPHGHKCMRWITPALVADAIEKRLATSLADA